MAEIPRITVVGSINMDFVIRTPRFPAPGENVIGGPMTTAPGGKGANQAVAAARLGAQVTLIGAVGDDAFGESLRATLERESIDASHVRIKHGVSTGAAFIPIDPSGENMIIVALGANLELTPRDIDDSAEHIQASDVLVMQLETPDETLLHAAAVARKAGVRTILNAAPAREAPPELLRIIDVLIVNRFEAAALLDEGETDPGRLAGRLTKLGPEEVIVTLGADGVVYFSAEGSRSQPSFAVEAVDATAAGDAFVAAWAVARAERQSAERSLEFGCAAGALAATVAGAIPSLPDRNRVHGLVSWGRHAR